MNNSKVIIHIILHNNQDKYKGISLYLYSLYNVELIKYYVILSTYFLV